MPYREILILVIYTPFFGLLLHSLLKAVRTKEINASGMVYKFKKKPALFFLTVIVQLAFLCLCAWMIQDAVRSLIFKE